MSAEHPFRFCIRVPQYARVCGAKHKTSVSTLSPAHDIFFHAELQGAEHSNTVTLQCLPASFTTMEAAPVATSWAWNTHAEPHQVGNQRKGNGNGSRIRRLVEKVLDGHYGREWI